MRPCRPGQDSRVVPVSSVVEPPVAAADTCTGAAPTAPGPTTNPRDLTGSVHHASRRPASGSIVDAGTVRAYRSALDSHRSLEIDQWALSPQST